MIALFREVENAYIQNFSRADDRGDHIVFWDERLPDMYAFNCTLVKKPADAPLTHVTREVAAARLKSRDFLQLILHPQIEVPLGLREQFVSLGLNVQTYLYMELTGRELRGFRGNEDCRVVRATSEQELEDGRRLDVETSTEAGTPCEFAARKALRKSEVFRDPAKQLFSYLCYHQDRAIGKCELFIKADYAKLEDFEVLASHQRRGFGSALLGKMIADAVELGARHIYLLTDKDDTPRDMYHKLGFAIIGEETQLFWRQEAEGLVQLPREY